MKFADERCSTKPILGASLDKIINNIKNRNAIAS